jgi:hypothetical protein
MGKNKLYSIRKDLRHTGNTGKPNLTPYRQVMTKIHLNI